jgi:hypothetical protein
VTGVVDDLGVDEVVGLADAAGLGERVLGAHGETPGPNSVMPKPCLKATLWAAS